MIIGKMHTKKRTENVVEKKEWGAAIRTAWSSGATLAPGGKIFENWVPQMPFPRTGEQLLHHIWPSQVSMEDAKETGKVAS